MVRTEEGVGVCAWRAGGFSEWCIEIYRRASGADLCLQVDYPNYCQHDMNMTDPGGRSAAGPSHNKTTREAGWPLTLKGTHNQSQKYSDPNYQKPILYPDMFYKSYSWHS